MTYDDDSTTTYTYDAGDRLTQVVDSLAGTIARTWDPLNRLTNETTPEGSVSYTYDAADRRATMTVNGQPQVTYGYDNADRLTSITQSSSTVGFSYDAADRRTVLTLPNGVTVEYGYDAASQVTGLTYKLGSTTLGDLLAGDRVCRCGLRAHVVPDPLLQVTDLLEWHWLESGFEGRVAAGVPRRVQRGPAVAVRGDAHPGPLRQCHRPDAQRGRRPHPHHLAERALDRADPRHESSGDAGAGQRRAHGDLHLRRKRAAVPFDKLRAPRATSRGGR